MYFFFLLLTTVSELLSLQWLNKNTSSICEKHNTICISQTDTWTIKCLYICEFLKLWLASFSENKGMRNPFVHKLLKLLWEQ